MAQEIIDLVIKADGSAAIASIKAVEGALSKLNSAQSGINQGVNKASAISSQAVSPSGQSKSNPQANFQNASQQVSSAARAATSAAQGIDRQTRALRNMNRELATSERQLAKYQDRLQKLQRIASAPESEQRALSKKLLGSGARPSMWSKEGLDRSQFNVERQGNVVNSRTLRRDSLSQDMSWTPESERRKFEAQDARKKAAADKRASDLAAQRAKQEASDVKEVEDARRVMEVDLAKRREAEKAQRDLAQRKLIEGKEKEEAAGREEVEKARRVMGADLKRREEKERVREQEVSRSLAKNDEKQAERARKLQEQRDKEEAKVADQRARNDVKTSQQAQLTQERNTRSRARYDEMYRGGNPTDKMMSEANRMNKEFDSRRTQRNAYAAERSANQNMYAERRSNTDLAIAGAILGAGGYAALQVPKYGVSQYDQYKQTMIGVKSVEGSRAGEVVEQARKDAQNMFGSGYRDVLNQQMLLRQSGQTTEQARASVLALSDINAGTPGGNADRMQRVAYNLAQVESQGKITGRDARDFEVNLLPIKEALSKSLGISKADVSERISKGEITADMVREAIVKLSQESRYKGRSAEVSENTVGGQWEKTQEEIQKTGELVGESLTPALISANKVLQSIATFMANNPSLTKGLGWTATAVGVAGVTAGGLSGGRAAAGMLGQAMPGLQKLPGVGGLFGEFGMKANTSATVANTMALNANTAAVAGGGAAGAADDLLGVGGKSAGKIGPMVAGLISTPIIIGAVAALAGAVIIKLAQDRRNTEDDQEPENDPNNKSGIPGDDRDPSKLKGAQQAQYYRDLANSEKNRAMERLENLKNRDIITEEFDPNNPDDWNNLDKMIMSPSERKMADEAKGMWNGRGAALGKARRLEKGAMPDPTVPQVAAPPNTDFMNWSSSGGSTAQTPAGVGSSASGGTGIKNIKENSDGSREVLLLLPPDQMSRDVRQATRRR